jgi:hypothetical protein
MTKKIHIDDFASGYLEAALWAETDGDAPLDDMYTINDISEETLDEMVVDCQKFQEENKELLRQAYSLYAKNDWTHEEQAGHDFWLTRNGHGCGFWDRGLGDVGDKLTVACREWGEFNLVVSNGKIYH